MTTSARYLFLIIPVAMAAGLKVYGELPVSEPIYVACDQQGMAYAPMSERLHLPWVMTDSGPLRADKPGAPLGRPMTCKEAQIAFGLDHEPQ